MTKGLVLEGGAMRGLFTAGVIDVLLENNIRFDGGVGVSAGAAFGVNYKSHQSGRVLRYNLRFAGNPRYASWKSWRQSGNLYAANFCYHLLPEKLDKFDKETFAKDPMEFWSVSTDAATGEANYHLLPDCDYVDLEWVRASASIPFFAHPVAIGGRFYFDGGVSDSIPIKFAQQHYTKNVLVTTQPKAYRKGKDKLWLIEKIVLRKYPAVLKKIRTRSQDYNSCLNYIEDQEEAGKIFVIRPPYSLDIGTMESDKNELRRVYNIGREEMEKQLPSLKRFLKEE
ncbi:patatin family protein [Lactobacillus hamsteri]|uniref:Alpha-beta hydrolase superfamily esterase n=1 Tax=Lactobacillus hamsteri DSM 5661 = JCM 6256 TaxID=1423754 RepID=A0A0R1YPN1_9LACO|nr:patatin family protein [Lactobacillus hamsteri]KRM41180.1 alpha-beta hydrolase superfamily esterase [Lactobacillus hamsteri DSM 5661 = JCM 6256]